jgi:hypothetical protein
LLPFAASVHPTNAIFAPLVEKTRLLAMTLNSSGVTLTAALLFQQ